MQKPSERNFKEVKFMDTKTFNENFTIDRKLKGVKAMPKQAMAAPACEIMTADDTAYDSAAAYFFFDSQTGEVRQSIGLRRDGEHLSTFGLRVIPISKLRIHRDDALADGQSFFKSERARLQKRIADYELEKTNDSRSLKSFLMAKE